MRDYELKTAGIMTGNSLDGADTVLTSFSAAGMRDLMSYSRPFPQFLKHYLNELRNLVNAHKGNVAAAEKDFDSAVARSSNEMRTDLEKESGAAASFAALSKYYVMFCAEAVRELTNNAIQVGAIKTLADIDIVGFHGQTCAHFPPSIAKTKDVTELYTVQLGDGQLLADLLGIPVVYDFRSDDLMKAGEAAPLAPMHHLHLAESIATHPGASIAFLNAGNSGNISITNLDRKPSVMGWDCGPCNHFSDLLAQRELSMLCDHDGAIGARGKINLDLLQILFERAVITSKGENFLLMQPPKSSDPEWYRPPAELVGESQVGGAVLPLEQRLRTAQYFSAYCFFYSLSFLPEDFPLPAVFVLSGGGWKNPVLLRHMQGLCAGDFGANPVLPMHHDLFAALSKKILSSGAVQCRHAVDFGIDGTAMEARLFADAAVCRIEGVPYSLPEITGVKSATVLGIVRFPGGNVESASPLVRRLWSDKTNLTPDGGASSKAWNRATAGWAVRLKNLPPK
ncbi:MAG: anhydro-N-acetylmuramic acid kinase [Deltaproteobacteria bacterium]|nr:anhydro-N-acetylmuramic acid kinase [Deltaproteobacteria bacterium]